MTPSRRPRLVLQHGLALIGLAFSAIGVAESNHALEFSGFVQLDSSWTDEVHSRTADVETDQELRRLRVSLDYDYGKDWDSELTLQYAERGNKLRVSDAWLRYSGWKFADVQLGKFKQSFGLERLEGARNIATLERAMISSSFAPGRSLGFQIGKRKKRSTWALGVFQEHDDDDQYTESEPLSFTGRYTRLLKPGNKQKIHLGLAASYRDWQGNFIRPRSRAEMYSGDNVVRGPRYFADTQVLLGLEGAWQKGPAHVQAEYMLSQTDASNFSQSYNQSGFYLQGSYFLTGEKRKYSKGRFGSVKPKHESGALEVVARYSYLDLRDGNLGAEATVSTLGINYYWRKNIKAMLNINHTELSGDLYHLIDDGDSLSMRLQYSM